MWLAELRIRLIAQVELLAIFLLYAQVRRPVSHGSLPNYRDRGSCKTMYIEVR